MAMSIETPSASPTIITSPYFKRTSKFFVDKSAAADQLADGPRLLTADQARAAGVQRTRRRRRARSKTSTKIDEVNCYVSLDKDIESPETYTSALEALILAKPVLIQESLFDNPWRVLVATTLLNLTSHRVALPALSTLLTAYPTPDALARACVPDVSTFLHPLGMYRIRAARLIRLSYMYLVDPPVRGVLRSSPRPVYVVGPGGRRERYPETEISHLPGSGPYAMDSYRIFCMPGNEEWKNVRPADKELIRYLKWKWAAEEVMRWTSRQGAYAQADAAYLVRLRSELEGTEPTR